MTSVRLDSVGLGRTVVGRRLGGLLPMLDAVRLGGVADGCCRMSMFS